jgi:hypothetical protein
MIVGYFASRSGQFKCIACDELGDFYQERPGETSCDRCPLNTQRYVNLLSATNRSACQCNSGACCIARPAKALGMVQAVVWPGCRLLPSEGQGRGGVPATSPLLCSPYAALYERGLLSVLQECAKCKGRKRLCRSQPLCGLYALLLVSHVSSTGPVGFDCLGRLSPPSRDAGGTGCSSYSTCSCILFAYLLYTCC